MSEIRVKSTGTIKLFESDNTSHVTIASPASLSANRTITIPDADVTLGAGVSLTGSTNNQVTTVTGANAITGETNFIYNGTIVGAGADGANADLGTGVHIKSGDSGQGSVEAEANLLILESASGGGLSIYTGNSHEAKINFGDSGNDNQGQIMYHHNGDSMRFNTNNDERMRIDSAGKVGIGETTPLGKLHVKTADSGGSVENWADELVIEGGGAGTGMSFLSNNDQSQSINFGDAQDSNAGMIQYSHYANNLMMHSGGAERMRIDSNGKLLVGVQSASNGQVEVKSSTTNSFKGYFANSTANFQNMRLYSDVGGTETETFRIENDGDVKNTNNSYGSLSDKRIKQDITDANSQWEDIKNLKIVNYKRKDQVAEGLDIPMIGVIAQDLEEAGMNGLVSESIPSTGEIRANSEFGTLEDIVDKDGNIEGVKEIPKEGVTVKSVKYSVLYMKAIKALQEAITKIETLETANTNKDTAIADLTTRLEALENA